MKRARVIAWVLGFSLTAYIASMAVGLIQERPFRVNGWVGHTQHVYRELQAVLIAALDGETNQRGFVITGHPDYLDGYRRSMSEVDRHIARVAFLTKDNPVQQNRVLTLQNILEVRYGELADTLNARTAGGDDAAASKVRDHVHLRRMESATAVVRTMMDAEDRLLVIRDRKAIQILYGLEIAALSILFRDLIIFSIFWKHHNETTETD